MQDCSAKAALAPRINAYYIALLLSALFGHDAVAGHDEFGAFCLHFPDELGAGVEESGRAHTAGACEGGGVAREHAPAADARVVDELAGYEEHPRAGRHRVAHADAHYVGQKDDAEAPRRGHGDRGEGLALRADGDVAAVLAVDALHHGAKQPSVGRRVAQAVELDVVVDHLVDHHVLRLLARQFEHHAACQGVADCRFLSQWAALFQDAQRTQQMPAAAQGELRRGKRGGEHETVEAIKVLVDKFQIKNHDTLLAKPRAKLVKISVPEPRADRQGTEGGKIGEFRPHPVHRIGKICNFTH